MCIVYAVLAALSLLHSNSIWFIQILYHNITTSTTYNYCSSNCWPPLPPSKNSLVLALRVGSGRLGNSWPVSLKSL